ncbi:hypothetical protein [Bordetella pertussis]|uniref:hypothetical protein n=1 Tax=Bordetella pertussis TaxID=520 RepID=UPI000AF36875
MNEILIVTLLVVSIFALLGCGVWVGLTLAGTAWIGMEVLSSRPATPWPSRSGAPRRAGR